MARATPSTTLLLALGMLLLVPIGTVALSRTWRNRALQPLSPLPTAGMAERAQPPAPTPQPPPSTLRPVDELLISVFEGRGPGPGTDLLPSGPRVDLVTEPDGTRIARIDLDRDGGWDETWQIGLDAIVREVSHTADGKPSERFTWLAGTWVPVPPGSP